MVGEDLRPPALEGVPERANLRHVVGETPAMALSSSTAAVRGSSVR